jgi:hypothetical protein
VRFDHLKYLATSELVRYGATIAMPLRSAAASWHFGATILSMMAIVRPQMVQVNDEVRQSDLLLRLFVACPISYFFRYQA